MIGLEEAVARLARPRHPDSEPPVLSNESDPGDTRKARITSDLGRFLCLARISAAC